MADSRTISSNIIKENARIHQGDVINNNFFSETSQGQARNEILRNLYKSPYEDRKNRNPPRVDGTCEWFVSHKHFRTWNESSSSSMLWVSADPGCGKSVLVRHLVDSVLQTTESRTVCYFFFKDDFSDQKSVISAICCILRQIFIQKPSLLADSILEKFNAGGEIFFDSFSELWGTLMQVAGCENAGEIICLVDAVDECGDQGRHQLLQALCTLYGTAKSFNLKFLVTSRPYAEIYRGLAPLEIPGLPVIHLSGESEDEMEKIAHEINIYIHGRVQRLELTESERKLLLEKLLRVPNRTFLWVYLTLDLIENNINIDKLMIEEATSSIPKSVDEAYERILSKSHNTARARKILHIVVAAARPLTVKEMNFALFLTENNGGYEDLYLLPDDRFCKTIRNICGLSVTIIDSKIYLLHQTVKEFLVKRDMMQSSRVIDGDFKWRHSLQLQESHRIIADICIWHLLAEFDMRPESSSRTVWSDRFLDYSAKHWATHFRELPAKTQSMMTESILKICDVTSSCCQTWFKVYWTTTDTEFPQGFTTLMIASYFGLNAVVQSLLLDNHDIDLDSLDYTYGRSALCWATRNDSKKVVELLIKGARLMLWGYKLPFKRRAKVDLADKYGRTPLTYAVWNGDAVLVILLLKAGARVRSKDELGGTPLSYAFCNRHDQIIELLLKRSSQADAADDIDKLLISAAKKGDEEVISLILKADIANTGLQNGSENIALMHAIENGHKAIVEILLKAGADPNQDTGLGGPLRIAIKLGYKAIVEILLKAGAYPNQDTGSEGPLRIATELGHKAIVEILLKAGADPNLKTRFRRPLTIATWQRYMAIEEILRSSRGGSD